MTYNDTWFTHSLVSLWRVEAVNTKEVDYNSYL